MATSTISYVTLRIDIDHSEHEAIFRFIGDVDENFRQESLPRLKTQKIIFELEDVHNFNSCGIREWVYLIRDFSKIAPILFRHCSVTMIDQINMVPDSMGSGTVESFFAPYYCPNDGEVNQLIHLSEHKEKLNAKQAPNFSCAKCQTKLEFDALEESYFLFVEDAFKTAS